jgi:hypothetical protein
VQRPAAEPELSPASVDLRPPGLQLSSSEVEFLARLGRLVPNPRAAKRMVNVYRLVRIGIPDGELAAFAGNEAGGPYQTVQVLLAILTGSPARADDIFRALLRAADSDDVATVIDAATGGMTPDIGTEIIRLRNESGLSMTVPECRRWCPVLARFSFHTRELATRPV